jgi:hypothetical protein
MGHQPLKHVAENIFLRRSAFAGDAVPMNHRFERESRPARDASLSDKHSFFCG